MLHVPKREARSVDDSTAAIQTTRKRSCEQQQFVACERLINISGLLLAVLI
jgi:hypothetical protein